MASPAGVYESFFVPAIFVPCSRLLVEAAVPAAGERALDVACGTGIIARTLAPLVGEAGTVTAVDLSPGMLEVARTLVPAGHRVDFREGNGTALGFPDASFDLVTCQHGLQFFPDRLAGTREMRRVLAPGGRAVVLCWSSLDDQSSLYRGMFEAEARHLNVPRDRIAAPFSLGNPEELSGLFTSAGFASVEVRPYTIQACFPSADQFLRLTMMAAAAVMPDLFQDPEGLIAAVQRDCAAELAAHRRGDSIEMPMHGILAVARV